MRPIFENSADIFISGNRVLRNASSTKIALKVRFGFFEHPKFGATLIDTGYGPASLSAPGRSIPLRVYAKLIAPKLLNENPVGVFLRERGYSTSDIKTIIVTHFHADHISELCQFPNARIFLHERALQHLKQGSALGLTSSGIFKELLPQDFEDRVQPIQTTSTLKVAPFDRSFDLFGDRQCCAVSLSGHAEGHFGVLFPCLEKPLLYAVDAEWLAEAILEERPPGFPASLVQRSKDAAFKTRAQVRQFVEQGGDFLLCHDPNPHPFDLSNSEYRS